MSRLCIAFVALLAAALPAAAQSVSNMYDSATVAREQSRLAARVNQVWTTAFEPNLNPVERQALSGVTIEAPLDGDPVIGYYSNSRTKVVTMPAVSLLFLEDLCTAFAWLYGRGYRIETVEEYASMLKYKDANAFGARFPSPRKALGIPDDALSDAAVNDLSLRLRNTAYAFILGHELGHVRFRHGGYNGVPVTVAQGNEAQADRFGLELMARVGEVPTGAMVFFQSAIFYFQNRADFPSDVAWQSYLTTKATHPVTAARLRELSTSVSALADRFARNDTNRSAATAAARFLGDQFATFAAFLDDADLQRVMRAKAERSAPATLLPRRQREALKDFPIR